MIVVDASAVCDLLLRRSAEPRLVDLVLANGASVHAPDLMSVEVLHAMRRMTFKDEMAVERADQMRQDLADLPIHHYPSGPLLDRAWALRKNVTIYDALYVALAEALDARLLTTDFALARAAVEISTVRVATAG